MFFTMDEIFAPLKESVEIIDKTIKESSRIKYVERAGKKIIILKNKNRRGANSTANPKNSII